VVAVVCGTGTGFAARHPKGECARASGLEYLLADEGGGFDIGLQGLRAATRANDGRGAGTELVQAAAEWALELGCATVFETVYETPHPKGRVATFAPKVLETADRGDAVALDIVRGAVDELMLGIEAVTRAVGVNGGSMVVAGSILLRGGAALWATFRRALESHGRSWSVDRALAPAIEILDVYVSSLCSGGLALPVAEALPAAAFHVGSSSLCPCASRPASATAARTVA
jgi:N-acetylglucosamine kinase-like BadF-type ATPase